MDKAFRNLIGLTGLVILAAAIGGYFGMGLEFYKLVILVSVGLILVSIRVYEFHDMSQFTIISLAWILGIYGISSLFATYGAILLPGVSVITWPWFDVSIWSMGIWYLVYPSALILHRIIKMSHDKAWKHTSIAAIDTLAIFGIILLVIASLSGFQQTKLTGGITGDWREFYVYGVLLLLYTASIRDYFRDEKSKWNENWKNLSCIIAFLGGMFLIGLSVSRFISPGMSVLTFLIQTIGGVFVCFMVYRLLQKEISKVVG